MPIWAQVFIPLVMLQNWRYMMNLEGTEFVFDLRQGYETFKDNIFFIRSLLKWDLAFIIQISSVVFSKKNLLSEG